MLPRSAALRIASRLALGLLVSSSGVAVRLGPEVAIAVGARAKQPGEGMTAEPVELRVMKRCGQGEGGRMEAYERLLGDAMLGDATLFARQYVVEAAWGVVAPVLARRRPPSSTSREAGARRRPTRWSQTSGGGTRRSESSWRFREHGFSVAGPERGSRRFALGVPV